jgi:hypothetical protein
MKWTDLTLHPTNRTLRQFALAWLVFLAGAGVHQWLARGHAQAGLILAALGVGVGLPGLARPALVRWLFVAAMVAAFPIGWVVSQVVLVVMFFGVITPVAAVLRLLGRDPLRRKPAPGSGSFWLPKATAQDVRSYFRQY